MDRVEITCVDNGKTKMVEVLSKTDKYMKVVIEETTMTIELTRKDLNKPYIGNKAGLDFTYDDHK